MEGRSGLGFSVEEETEGEEGVEWLPFPEIVVKRVQDSGLRAGTEGKEDSSFVWTEYRGRETADGEVGCVSDTEDGTARTGEEVERAEPAARGEMTRSRGVDGEFRVRDTGKESAIRPEFVRMDGGRDESWEDGTTRMGEVVAELAKI